MGQSAIMYHTSKTSDSAETVAEILLRLGAVELNFEVPFTWVSGMKSPIYCDNRVINSNVDARKKIVDLFVDVIKSKYKNVEIIAGVATGGIPMGVLVADRMSLPFIYVRQERKEHGLMKQVEGVFSVDDTVVLIEDHISTGGSSVKAIRGLKEAGLDVLGLISIMTYGFASADYTVSDEELSFISLCDLDAIANFAEKEGLISELDKKSLLEFKQSPSSWLS